VDVFEGVVVAVVVVVVALVVAARGAEVAVAILKSV
jgi:hypothetical protein